jgi:hypothetical protein
MIAKLPMKRSFDFGGVEMFPKNITRDDIIKALNDIDHNGIPIHHDSTRHDLIYKGKHYPPQGSHFICK